MTQNERDNVFHILMTETAKKLSDSSKQAFIKEIEYDYSLKVLPGGFRKYALLRDGTIVKPMSDFSIVDEHYEFFFEYRYLDKLKRRRKSAWCFSKDIIGEGDSIRILKKQYRKHKKEENYARSIVNK